ncbi:lytic murein transglycosylase B [Amphritea sp.]|uniref:lytic murein transglycosylase B n=1 Tax=Amphritea sp. TaxID=1872502 RepID=UPI003A905E69
MFRTKFSGLLAGVVLCSGLAWGTQVAAHGYGDHPAAQQFIANMAKEGFDEAEVKTILRSAERQESILKAISRPAEKRLNWGEYRNIFLRDARIKQGVEFWHQYSAALQRAEKEYGVPAHIIVAIIGVETRYGRNMGSYRVIDALSTLGFDYPPRGKFFQGQLKEYFYLLREEKADPFALKGSYAGAMGYGQFIPSSFRSFAVDFDGDGKKDIWNNPVDAIGSVANYFSAHGWKKGEAVRSNVVMQQMADEAWINSSLKPEVTLAEWAERGIRTRKDLNLDSKATLMRLEKDGEFQHWFGLHNFYVITRYNHSRLYAMAVYELGQAVAEKHKANAG